MDRELDQSDRKILNELQNDARLTHQDLSEKIGLSPSPCARRVRRLEQEGFITGYSAIIDQEKLGFGFTVFVSVQLDRQIDERLIEFEKAIKALPEVLDCWLMTGNRDYLLRVVVADLKEFERFMTGRLTKIQGVDSLESSVPIRQVKSQMARLR